MTGLVMGLVLSLTVGFLIVRLLLQNTIGGNQLQVPTGMLGGFLTPGLGLGISACVYFLHLVLFDRDILVWIDLALIVLLLIPALSGWRNRQQRSVTEPAPLPFIRVAFFTALSLSALWFVLYSIWNPHGDWDAWAIWNMRARFLERGGDGWQTAFDQNLAWSHPDYPLLVPASVARLWSYASAETTLAPIIVAGAFLFGTAGILYSSLRGMVSKSQAMLAVAVLLGSPHFVKAGAAQQADIPVAFFFLASAATLQLHDRAKPPHARLMVLVGILSGLAAWTKNEGLLLTPALLFSRLLTVPRTAGWNTFARESVAFVCGALPVLAVVFYFKAFIAPPSELLLAGKTAGALHKITDLSRYAVVVTSYAKEITFLGMSLPLLAYGLFAGKQQKQNEHRNITSLVLTFVCVALGHVAVYLITPYDIQWHINTSLNRLLLQLWPVVVFITFLVVNTPEHMLKKE